MERFDRLTSTGLDPVEAMRRVAPFFDRPAARPGEHTLRASLGTASTPDTLVDDARGGALPERSLGQQQPQPATATPAVTLDGAAAGSTRTAAELAKDGFPEPLTGEVLAAGRVRPKAPTSTAPAAVRASGLATAARAAAHGR